MHAHTATRDQFETTPLSSRSNLHQQRNFRFFFSEKRMTRGKKKRERGDYFHLNVTFQHGVATGTELKLHNTLAVRGSAFLFCCAGPHCHPHAVTSAEESTTREGIVCTLTAHSAPTATQNRHPSQPWRDNDTVSFRTAARTMALAARRRPGRAVVSSPA